MVRWIAFLVAFVPSVAWAQVDICLEMMGNRAAARGALAALGLDRETMRGGDIVSTSDAAIDIWLDPVISFGQTDAAGNVIVAPVIHPRPIIRLRFHSVPAMGKARNRLVNAGALPGGLRRIACPTTRIWFGD